MWTHLQLRFIPLMNLAMRQGQGLYLCGRTNAGDDFGGHCFETKDEITDGIPYDELNKGEK